MNIYAGNLSRELTEDDLKETFAAYGGVDSVKIITDKFTGISRGFGFVEMPDESEAQNANGELNGKELKGRTIIVNKARLAVGKSIGMQTMLDQYPFTQAIDLVQIPLPVLIYLFSHECMPSSRPGQRPNNCLNAKYNWPKSIFSSARPFW